MGRLDGRVIAITGASAGIGRTCAERFARAGAHVAMSARRAERLDEIAGALRAEGHQAIAVPGDVTLEEDAAALVERTLTAFGRLDVMIANAGAGFHGTLEETPPDVARTLMNVNFMGTFLSARAALPVFRRQQAGHLIIVSSIVGRRGIAGSSAYGATKAAQVSFGEALRTELAGSNIHVSLVYPVSTHTEFHDAMERDYGHRITGLGPKQDAEEVARAIEHGILSPRPEIYPYGKAKLLAVLNSLAPGLTDRVVKKYGRRRNA